VSVERSAAGRHAWSTAVTPATVMGPFYPVGRGQQGSKLVVAGRRARGELLDLAGTVRDLSGRPLAGIVVEIWQANAMGRYDHPSDGNPAPLDPAFLGWGMSRTDAEGRYRFHTIVPAGYPVTPEWARAPHVHFQLTGRCDRHVTQMWFPRPEVNAQDRLWTALAPADRERLTARITDVRAGACRAAFDIVLPNG
jgi:protocatechuate 3,4-dioxygenase beta subunit